MPACDAAEGVGQRDTREGTDEGRDRHRRRGVSREQHDGRGRADTGARRRTEEVRVGERIAEHPLVSRAGDREQAADQGCGQHTGQPDLEQQIRLQLREPRIDLHARQPIEQFHQDGAHGEVDRSHQQACGHRPQQDEDGDEQRHRPQPSRTGHRALPHGCVHLPAGTFCAATATAAPTAR